MEATGSAQRQDEASTAVLQPFRYHPLPPGEIIRVMELSDTAPRLECKIRQVPLLQAQYKALSYVWGSPEKPHRIVVVDEDNEPSGYISVTSNLHNLLKDLRSAAGIQSNRFWIDQITINQADDQEKGHQVDLMRKIYRHASQVITYLGPHSPDDQEESRVLSLLSRLDAHFRPNYAYFTDRKREYLHRADYFPVPQLPSTISTEDPAWSALVRIACGEWTERLWMIQENFLCSDNTMLRGHQLLDWFSVTSIPFLFYTGILPNTLLSQPYSNKEIAWDPSVNIDRLLLTWDARWERRNGESTTVQLRDLVQNLSYYNRLQCRDRRDKVFALLGISSDAEALGIESDYNSPVEDVLVRISTQIYKRTRSMDLLDVISEQSEHANLSVPSWVYVGTEDANSAVEILSPHPDSHIDVGFEDGNRVMIARGRIINKISFLTPAVDFADLSSTQERKIQFWKRAVLSIVTLWERPEASRDTLDNFLSAWTADSSWSPSIYGVSSEFCIWALYRCFVMQWYVATNGSIAEDDASSALLHGILCKLRAAAAKNAGNNLTNDLWEKVSPEENQVGTDLWQRTRIQGRAMGVTENGYICNVTGRAQGGDVIALLQGGDAVYVLRPAGDRFRFIGTAYVHEYAKGAAYVGVDKDVVDQDIRII